MNFITELGSRIVKDLSVYDLTRNPEYNGFDFIGFRETTLGIDYIALVRADAITEKAIVRLRDAFFDITQNSPKEFAIKSYGRMPNGVLIFVFERDLPALLIQFIKRQVRVSHSINAGALMVSWSLDLAKKAVYTHSNPISLLPPVIVLAGNVFPGLNYLESFIASYAAQPLWQPGADVPQPSRAAYTPAELKALQERLGVYRATLNSYLEQLAIHGKAYAPPGVVYGIHEMRAHIARTKQTLHTWGVQVEDLHDDEA
jgi:hypothetical protein